MKFFILLAACLAVSAAQLSKEQDIVIVKEQLHDNIGTGGYNYAYELSDGQQRQESAELKNAGSEEAFIVMKGSYSYVDPATGMTYTVTYVADENGFRAEGDHLPK